ncbi:STAS domain-containing protein [Actinoallomurus soli]|uniref:STAS domain-containing protein n=1 Tax=Actinoallomurus soli TaxID=2952535 RepID=UPI002092246E|nr:STAS domain-containing protein [Actinoallomurus soli]MCO5972976.1 STAS domain-containing protein [Actinoallomurus soli]
MRPGAAPIVSLRGELDIAGTDALEDLVLDVLLRHGPDVVIDGFGVTFCDARGLGALVRCANEAGRAGGRLTLVRPSHRLRRLMRLVGLDRLLCAAAVPAPRRPGGSCSTMSTHPR